MFAKHLLYGDSIVSTPNELELDAFFTDDPHDTQSFRYFSVITIHTIHVTISPPIRRLLPTWWKGNLKELGIEYPPDVYLVNSMAFVEVRSGGTFKNMYLVELRRQVRPQGFEENYSFMSHVQDLSVVTLHPKQMGEIKLITATRQIDGRQKIPKKGIARQQTINLVEFRDPHTMRLTGVIHRSMPVITDLEN